MEMLNSVAITLHAKQKKPPTNHWKHLNALKKMCLFSVWAKVLTQKDLHFYIYSYSFLLRLVLLLLMLFCVLYGSFPLFILYQWPISENNVHSSSDLVFPMRSWYQMRLGGRRGREHSPYAAAPHHSLEYIEVRVTDLERVLHCLLLTLLHCWK